LFEEVEDGLLRLGDKVLGRSLCKVLEHHPPAKKNEKRVFEVFAEFVVFALELPLEAGRIPGGYDGVDIRGSWGRLKLRCDRIMEVVVSAL